MRVDFTDKSLWLHMSDDEKFGLTQELREENDLLRDIANRARVALEQYHWKGDVQLEVLADIRKLSTPAQQTSAKEE